MEAEKGALELHLSALYTMSSILESLQSVLSKFVLKPAKFSVHLAFGI